MAESDVDALQGLTKAEMKKKLKKTRKTSKIRQRRSGKNAAK